MINAIRKSDNDAAKAIWASLGNPAEAAAKVQAVLAGVGDNTVVQSVITAPGYSAFGQTIWPLCNQAHFIAAAACEDRNAVVLDLMSQIISDQRWGLGSISGARFKGGWGPSEGPYLVRQFGTVPTPQGPIAVAIAAKPTSGSYAEGRTMLSTLANWISERINQFAALRLENATTATKLVQSSGGPGKESKSLKAEAARSETTGAATTKESSVSAGEVCLT